MKFAAVGVNTELELYQSCKLPLWGLQLSMAYWL